MKRWVSTVVIAAVVGLAAFSLADAQGRGRGPGGGPGMGAPGGRGLIPFARIGDLTDAQREQIREILQAERQDRQGPPAAAKLHRELEAELLADAPDDRKVETLRQQIAQAHAEALAQRIAVRRKIVQVLTPEQRAKARERLAEAPERGRRAR